MRMISVLLCVVMVAASVLALEVSNSSDDIEELAKLPGNTGLLELRGGSAEGWSWCGAHERDVVTKGHPCFNQGDISWPVALIGVGLLWLFVSS